MNTLATPFRTILKGLQAVIGIVLTKERHREPILTRIYLHLNRTLARFEKLVANWQNNTLPKPRQRAPRPTRPGAGALRPSPARTGTTPRLPTSRAWLIRNVDHYNFRGHASQLQHFLASPECVAFLAEVPRAGRILRPLARSLGIQMPGDPPPPAPKPAKPAATPYPPPASPPVRAQHSPFSLRHPIFSKAR